MHRPTSKGMWNLAKGSPSQQAVQLPKTYSDHWPLGPPARPAHLTHWSQGPSPKPVCCLSCNRISPFSEILEALVTPQCSPSGWSWNSPVPPGSTYCPGRGHGNPKPASGQPGEESHKSSQAEPPQTLWPQSGHVLVGACQQHPTEGPLWLSKRLRKKEVRCASRRHLIF